MGSSVFPRMSCRMTNIIEDGKFTRAYSSSGAWPNEARATSVNNARPWQVQSILDDQRKSVKGGTK